MTKQPRRSTSIHSLIEFACLLTLGGVLGVAAGACREDQDGVDPVGEQICRDYCDHAVECDDERNKQNCIDKCIDRMGDCQADEQDAAFDQLEVCASESCDDFLGCTINAGATCYFGL